MTTVAKVPLGLGWEKLGIVRDPDGRQLHGWLHAETATQVMSSIAMAEQPRSGTVGPQWHVSVVDRTRRDPARPRPRQVDLARCAFDMLAAEEDNHHPGAARQFWLPVDPSERVDCECKATEETIEEPDGYRWTNPTDAPCRGCDFARTMSAVGQLRPCPIHSTTAVSP